ncbi:MAG: rhomboid family intramembrane serine protease [Fidelibacterota bacterium]
MRYQFTSRGSRQMFQSSIRQTPPGVKLLITINIIVFILVELSGVKAALFHNFGLVPYLAWHELKFWQPFTYLFLHGGLMHLAVNMFVLWMFGMELETVWGRKSFLKYYFITGVGSGIITMLFQLFSPIPVVGASGAIYGLLLAYGLLYPERTVYVYFFIPIKIKYFVMILAGISFLASLSPGQSVISHLTHLSGMAIGFLYLRYGINVNLLNYLALKFKLHRMKPSKGTKKSTKPPKVDDTLFRRRVDDILDKMNQVGWDNLTEAERDILYSASKRQSKDHPPN